MKQHVPIGLGSKLSAQVSLICAFYIPSGTCIGKRVSSISLRGILRTSEWKFPGSSKAFRESGYNLIIKVDIVPEESSVLTRASF